MQLHSVPARTGITWVRQGLRAFWCQPLAISSLVLTMISTLALTSLIPYVSWIFARWVLVMFTLVILIAAKEAHQGKFPTPSVVLAALRAGKTSLRDMAILGLCYSAAYCAVLAVGALFDGGTFALVALAAASPPTLETLDSVAAVKHAMLVTLLLHLPLSLAFWMAPGLMHWHGIPPVKALFFSFMAIGRNIGAFVMFGLGCYLIAMVAGLGLTIIASIFTPAGSSAELIALSPVTIGLVFALSLVLVGVVLSAIAFALRDCFSENAPTDKTPLASDSAEQV